MAALTQHSHEAILGIISEMTRPIADILGEPPLTPLETHSRKLRHPLAGRSEDTPSEADILTITRSYRGPKSFLDGGRVSQQLAEPRRRPRAGKSTIDSVGRKRRREEKLSKSESSNSKRDGETRKKPKTEEAKPRSTGNKLTSQPTPREKDEVKKTSRSVNEPSPRKSESIAKEPKREVKKQLREDPADEPMKDAKDPARKTPSIIPKIPASVVPRSAPPPLRSAPTEKAKSEIERQQAKTKETENKQTRLSIPRVRPSEKNEGKRSDNTARRSTKDSPERALSSPERRRPRSRPSDTESTRHRDSETDRGHERRERRLNREWDRDFDSDREISSRDRGHDRDRDLRRDRDKDRDRGKDRDRNRDRDRDRDRDLDRDREYVRQGSGRSDRENDIGNRSDQRRELRDRDNESHRRENGRHGNAERSARHHSNEHQKNYMRHRERTALRSSVPPSRPESSRESTSGGGSPAEGRGISLSSKPVTRNPNGVGSRPRNPSLSRTEVDENLAKQKEMKKEFLGLVATCEELSKKKDYDAYEEASRRAFCVGFNLGLAMENELRLDTVRYKALSGSTRTSRNRPIIDHYRSLTKDHVRVWQEDFDQMGRSDAVAFFKRSTKKVYFRMFIVHHLWNKDEQYTFRSLKDTLSKAVAGNKEKEDFSRRSLDTLRTVVRDYSNILSIFEGIATDYGSGYDEPGMESYVPL